jgi:hypothetical protein
MSASASAAPPVAANYDSKDSPTMGEVSDVVNDGTTVVNGDMCDDNNDKNSDNSETLDDVFFVPPGTS